MAKTIFSSDQEKLQVLLRTLREEAGLTQVQLAEKLGKPQSYVSKYESGERLLDLIELREVARGCGVSLVDVVKRFEL